MYGSAILYGGRYTGYVLQITTSQFLNLSYLLSKTKLQQANKLERKCNDMWYVKWYGATQICIKGYTFDIGYKAVSSKRT